MVMLLSRRVTGLLILLSPPRYVNSVTQFTPLVGSIGELVLSIMAFSVPPRYVFWL